MYEKASRQTVRKDFTLLFSFIGSTALLFSSLGSPSAGGAKNLSRLNRPLGLLVPAGRGSMDASEHGGSAKAVPMPMSTNHRVWKAVEFPSGAPAGMKIAKPRNLPVYFLAENETTWPLRERTYGTCYFWSAASALLDGSGALLDASFNGRAVYKRGCKFRPAVRKSNTPSIEVSLASRRIRKHG